MTFPNNAWEHAESAPEFFRNGNESTFRQNFGNSFSRHQYKHKIHIHKTTTKLYIYIKPQASHIHQTTSFTYTSNHKFHIHIYIKPQASYTHIHQITSFSFIKGGQDTTRKRAIANMDTNGASRDGAPLL